MPNMVVVRERVHISFIENEIWCHEPALSAFTFFLFVKLPVVKALCKNLVTHKYFANSKCLVTVLLIFIYFVLLI